MIRFIVTFWMLVMLSLESRANELDWESSHQNINQKLSPSPGKLTEENDCPLEEEPQWRKKNTRKNYRRVQRKKHFKQVIKALKGETKKHIDFDPGEEEIKIFNHQIEIVRKNFSLEKTGPLILNSISKRELDPLPQSLSKERIPIALSLLQRNANLRQNKKYFIQELYLGFSNSTLKFYQRDSCLSLCQVLNNLRINKNDRLASKVIIFFSCFLDDEAWKNYEYLLKKIAQSITNPFYANLILNSLAKESDEYKNFWRSKIPKILEILKNQIQTIHDQVLYFDCPYLNTFRPEETSLTLQGLIKEISQTAEYKLFQTFLKELKKLEKGF